MTAKKFTKKRGACTTYCLVVLLILFPVSRNFYVRMCVKFTFASKIEAKHERSRVRVKVEPRSTCRLNSALFILPLFYLCDENLRALTCVAKNASEEINLNGD